MHIHFVCSGNTFRSRIAEAMFNSQNPEGHSCSSSGVHAEKNLNGPVAWYTARLLHKNNLIPFMSNMWVQTTFELLSEADKVIFMSGYHLDYCIQNLGYNDSQHEVWNIEDIQNTGTESLDDEIKYIKKSERIFGEINEKVDKLIQEI